MNVKFNASTWNFLSLVILSAVFNVSVLGFYHVFCLKNNKASNAFPDIGSVGRIEKKNPKRKKNHNKSRNKWPWYPRMTLKVKIHTDLD